MKPYFSFQWHITDECDQRCKHCYIFSGGNYSCLKSMSWQEIQDTFNNCLDFCETYGRTPYFYLTGGDPILHPDFWKLLGLFRENNVIIVSQGYHNLRALFFARNQGMNALGYDAQDVTKNESFYRNHSREILARVQATVYYILGIS